MIQSLAICGPSIQKDASMYYLQWRACHAANIIKERDADAMW